MLEPTETTEQAGLWRILEVTRRLGAPADLEQLLGLVIEAGREVLQADRGTVFLYDRQTEELYSSVATGAGAIRFPADQGIAGECVRSRSVVNVADCYADDRFNRQIDKQTGYRTRCLLTVPLIGYDESLVGVLQLLNKVGDCPFDEQDEQLALALGAQCAVAIQRALLIEEHLVKQKLERDLSIAREIQTRVLPRELPVLSGYDLAAWSRPADQTGGDIYDALCLEERQMMLLLGDATGHGIGPALSVTQVRAMFRIALRLKASLDETFTHVNNQLTEDLPSNRFVTAFMGLLDADGHQIRYHAGGQGPLLIYRAASGACELRDASTFPLGIVADIPLDAPPTIDLAPGDVVALLSDGIYEYADRAGEQFGEEAVGQVVARHAAEGADAVIQALLAAVKQHAGGAAQADDMTMVIVRRTA